METIIDQQLPKFETRGRITRVNFDEEQFSQESEGKGPKQMWRYVTACFPCTAGLQKRIDAIIDAIGTNDEESRDKADMLARESVGQTLSDEYLWEMQRRSYKRERDVLLQTITYTFPDGSVIQVRPQDQNNIQTAIDAGEPQLWIMEDNTVRLTTVDELSTALDSGIAQGKAIWNDYANKIKTL
jgi:hypothetical protein